ncbi:hypothetical protein MBLNU457_4385t1 [Dothideomycetes sp. NU457]
MGRDAETVYQSGPAPPRQRRFPAQNRTIRPRRSSTRQSLIRDQPTLTQLDFCTPPERQQSTDDTDDEYGDNKQSRPARKRRKQIGRQTTMTQFYSSFGTDQEDDVYELPDDAIEDIKPLSPTRIGIEATTMTTASDTVKRETLRYGNPTCIPQTPIKPVKDEIPSSQTPQSIYLSGRTRRQLYLPQRSPLKEKSKNVQATPVYGEQRAARQASTELPLSPPDRATFHTPAVPKLRHTQTIPDSEDNGTLEALETQKTRSPKLKRVTSTIEDSQFESLGEEITFSLDRAHQQFVAETQAFRRPDATARDRVVQETQFDTLASDLEDDDDDEEAYPDFDPACSALDRDAARFMQTQRLLNARRFLQSQKDWHPDIVFHTVEPPIAVEPQKSPAGTAQQKADDNDAASDRTHSIESTPELSYAARADYVARPFGPLPANIETIDLTSTPPPVPISSTQDDIPTPHAAERVPDVRPEIIHSSPPPIPPSQATTVDGTQLPLPRSSAAQNPHLDRRPSLQAPSENISSSPLPHNPSSPYHKHAPESYHRRSSFSLYTSDSLYHADNGPSHPHRKRLKRAVEMLPDSYLDFSLPVAPVDYSLPAPSSDWRNNLKRGREE